MRNKWLTMWVAVMVLALILPAAVQAASAQPAIKTKSIAFEMEFDGKTIKLPEGQYLFVYKGTSYVPVRFISYALQKSVKWDQKAKKVTVAEPTANELIVLKEYLMNAAGAKGQSSSKGDVPLAASPIAASFVFDGAAQLLPAGQTAYMLNNSVYVPVRFMSESIGTAIAWDAAGHRIVGQSQVYREAQQSNAGGSASGNNATTGNGGTDASAAPGGGIPGGGVPGGGIVTAKPTEQEIKSEAEQQLQVLYSNARTKFLSLLGQYQAAADEATKQSVYAQGEAYLADVTAQFNQILAATEAKLTANGYSTAVINDYRARFQSEIEAGRAGLAYMTGA